MESATPVQVRFDQEQAERFFAALGRDPSSVWIQPFTPKGNGRKAGPYDPEAIERLTPDHCVATLINIGQRELESITACAALKMEWDKKPREWQLTAWEKIGLRPTIVVDSGGRSIHLYWVFREPIDLDLAANLQARLFAALEGDDASIKGFAQPMRLPGTLHHDKTTGEVDGRCVLLNDDGPRYTAEELDAALPALPKPTRGVGVRKLAKGPTEYADRTVKQLRELFFQAPPFASSTSDAPSPYDRDLARRLVAGAVDELRRIGADPCLVDEWVREHMPEWKGGPDVVEWAIRDGNGAIQGSSFYGALKEMGVKVKAQRSRGVTPNDKVKPTGKPIHTLIFNTAPRIRLWLKGELERDGVARPNEASYEAQEIVGLIRDQIKQNKGAAVDLSKIIDDIITSMDLPSVDKFQRRRSKQRIESIINTLCRLGALALTRNGFLSFGTAADDEQVARARYRDRPEHPLRLRAHATENAEIPCSNRDFEVPKNQPGLKNQPGVVSACSAEPRQEENRSVTDLVPMPTDQSQNPNGQSQNPNSQEKKEQPPGGFGWVVPGVGDRVLVDGVAADWIVKAVFPEQALAKVEAWDGTTRYRDLRCLQLAAT